MAVPVESGARVAVRREVPLPLAGGACPALVSFTGFARNAEHFVLRFGPLSGGTPPLVRVHSECITGDLFRSERCDCGSQLEQSRAMLAREGGLLVYLRQEGRGIGLYAKIDAYGLQDEGMDTFAANAHLALPTDARDYQCAAEMLKAMGVESLRLMTNNPDKARQLEAAGLTVAAVLPTRTFETPHNRRYLQAKKTITRHSLLVDSR